MVNCFMNYVLAIEKNCNRGCEEDIPMCVCVCVCVCDFNAADLFQVFALLFP